MMINWKKILAVVLGLILLVGVAWLVLRLKGETKPSGVPVGLKNETSTVMADNNTSGWKAYRSEFYGFEFKYPSSVYLISSQPKKIELSTMSPSDPKQQSSLGLASKFSVSVITGQSLNEIEKGFASLDGFSRSTDSIGGEKIDTIVYREPYGNSVIYVALFDRNDSGYVLEVSFFQSQVAFKDILSTFKFKEPTVSSVDKVLTEATYYGTFLNQVYANKFFGVKFTLPSGFSKEKEVADLPAGGFPERLSTSFRNGGKQFSLEVNPLPKGFEFAGTYGHANITKGSGNLEVALLHDPAPSLGGDWFLFAIFDNSGKTFMPFLRCATSICKDEEELKVMFKETVATFKFIEPK
ncbi:MAG: hypothetical protein HY093_00900 [Candidatus Liptonbacteria bacterium]|nr:hypothetical protein [Candidatus Liptonbacteria bacterium]